MSEEADQLHRSIKKPKRTTKEANLDGFEVADSHTMDVEHPCAGGSFADAVQGRTARNCFYTGEDEEDALDDLALTDVFQQQDDGGELVDCPFVELNWERYKQRWLPWRRALILKVLGKNFSLKIIAPRIKQAWQLQEDCELIDLDKGFFVARFFSRADYLKALEGGPWLVLGHYLMVSKWRPNFVPSDAGVATTRVWIRLTRVPIEQFYEEALLDMENGVGKAIRVEQQSVDVVRGRFARVCIELNLQQPLVPVINVMGRRQEVEYEGLHRVCYKCGQFGHQADACPTGSAPPRVDDPASSRPVPTPSPPNRSTPSNPYGPWLMPAHVRKKMEQAQRRMSQRAVSSPANQALNRQVEQELQGQRPPLRGATSQVRRPFTAKGSLAAHGDPPISEVSPTPTDTTPVVPAALSSRFAVLEEITEDSDMLTKINKLKHKIQDISSPHSSGGPAHARSKGNKGKAPQGSGPPGGKIG